MFTTETKVQTVIQLIVDKFGVDQKQLSYDTSFTDDLGVDSLDVYELIMTVEKHFKINIPDEDAEKITTVGLLIDYLDKRFFG